MDRRLIVVLGAASGIAGAAAAPLLGQTPPLVTAFVHVAVVPMDREQVLHDQTVVVHGDRIVALGPGDRVAVPPEAVRVDGTGKFLIPGLADMHAHLRGGAAECNWISSDHLLLKEQQLFLWLARGLTTIRNVDHEDEGDERRDDRRCIHDDDLLTLRARAAVGEILSPRIYTSGFVLGSLARSEPGAPQRPISVAEAVRAYKAAGFDFIKVHTSDKVNFDSLVVAARQVGLPLDGHAVVPLERVFTTYRSIEHLSGYLFRFWSEPPPALDLQESPDVLAARIRELAAATQRAGVWNTPTLYNAIRNEAVEQGGEQGTKRLALARELIKALQDAGAGLLLGSDRLGMRRSRGERGELAPEQLWLETGYGYAGATHLELRALVEEAGLTPYQALVTGTRNVAAFFGTLDSAGTLTVGKRADMVLVEGNPLVDIRQTERIAGVMLGGRWLDRTELDRRIAAIGDWAARWCSPAAVSAGYSQCEPFLEDPDFPS